MYKLVLIFILFSCGTKKEERSNDICKSCEYEKNFKINLKQIWANETSSLPKYVENEINSRSLLISQTLLSDSLTIEKIFSKTYDSLKSNIQKLALHNQGNITLSRLLISYSFDVTLAYTSCKSKHEATNEGISEKFSEGKKCILSSSNNAEEHKCYMKFLAESSKDLYDCTK